MTDDRQLPEAIRKIYPFARHWHDHDGVRQHYVDEGEGTPVVMVHGNPTWSFYYRRLIDRLRGGFRVIAPDHVGCGLSDKPQDYPYTLQTHIDNLDRLLEPMDLQNATLVVHDWGGPIGLGWAARHPERVGRLVILNTSCFPGGRAPIRIRMCGGNRFGAFAVRTLNLFALGALWMAVQKKWELTREERAGLVFPYDSYEHRIAVHRFVQDIPRSPSVPSHGVLGDIHGKLKLFARTPVLIQWGEQDWCFTPAMLRQWMETFPQAEVDLYPEGGHYVLEDVHEWILPRVEDFLRDTGA